MKWIWVCGLLVAAGCSKKSAPLPVTEAPAEATAAAKAAQAPASSTDSTTASESMDKTLARLTQALRKFSAENRRVPKSFDELVAMGYLQELPQTPPGKKFSFDDQLRVTLKPVK